MSKPDPWFPYRHANPAARHRLFCLPPGGGGATIYFPWQRLLLPYVEVCALQLPGREQRLGETPFTQMSSVVEAATAAIAPLLDLPFSIFGHSMGALIAFEMACRARELGSRQPTHLFLSAYPAPHHSDPDPIHRLAHDPFIAELRQLGFPDEVIASADLMEMLIPIARADAELVETHVHRASDPLRSPITVFIGSDDRKFAPDTIRDWRAYTNADFTEVVVPGGHGFLRPQTPVITQTIAKAIV